MFLYSGLIFCRLLNQTTSGSLYYELTLCNKAYIKVNLTGYEPKYFVKKADKPIRSIMSMLFFVLSTLFLLFFTSLARYLYLSHSETVKQKAKINLPSYDIGKCIKNLRNNKKIHPISSPKINPTPSSSMLSSDTSKANHQKLPLTPVLADSAIAGASVFHQYLAVDSHLYEGISNMSGEQMDNMSDLSAKLQTYSHNSEGLTEGALNKVKGHVAESHVFKHFEEAGINVEWPESSNQEGWDLLFNGNPVQVKLVKNANDLTEHFKENPGIPVVIPADAENIPDNAFYFDPSEGTDSLLSYLKDNPTNRIIVDPELSSEAITESVDAGTDLALGKTAGFSFPFVTAAFSGYREIQLLRKGDTDITSSLKNAGLDIIGVAGGTAIGSVILPGVGTFAGGPIGRHFTNKIKQKALKKAIGDFKKAGEELQKISKQTGQKYEEQFHQDKQSEQEHLNQIAFEAKNNINAKVQNLKDWTIQKEKPSEELKQRLLNNIPDSTVGRVTRLNWMEYFWPSQELIIYEKNKQVMQDLKASFTKDFQNNKYRDRGLLFQAFAQRGLCRQFILSEIEKAEQERHKRENNIIQQVCKEEENLLSQRVQSMKSLSDQMKIYIEEIREALYPYIKNMQKYQNRVKKEAKKFGLSDNLKAAA